MQHHLLCYLACYIVGYITCYITCYVQAVLQDRQDAQTASLFTASELLIQEHVRKYKYGAEVKDLIRLCDLNTWMWHYGRGRPRRVTVAEGRGRAAAEGSHRRCSHEGCWDSEASQGRAMGRFLQPKIPGSNWWICVGLKTCGAL